MCDRYALPDQATAEREFLPARAWWNFTPRFNVAAQQYVPAIRWHDGQSEAVMMRWGLIPSWAEGRWIDLPPACVDIDEIQSSATFRGAWLNSQRCILPIAGFYAWQLTDAKYRQPFFVSLLERPVFGLAGVWDRSVGEDDDVIEGCSVIRVPANDLMTNIANTEHRMPAIKAGLGEQREAPELISLSSCTPPLSFAVQFVRVRSRTDLDGSSLDGWVLGHQLDCVV